MTEPHQRTRSLLKTRRFLEGLTRPGDTPGIADDMRKTARQLLKHYPTDNDLDDLHEGAPDVLGPVEQRQPLGDAVPAAVRKGRYLPFAPIPPRLNASAEEREEYSKKVAAHRKIVGY
ncbi:MAG: hypothetical protein PHS32_20925 [Rhodoferax sp.]|uniref:BPSL0761 family protein n=1 Tax=Rhodoferax sp. TaxID=50421 RepID=UPI00261712A4|nr:BPSL0761 family protein [Rhodoferax sp.]MDD5336207.1 hypothetical protein [Rhodoferax sp.]